MSTGKVCILDYGVGNLQSIRNAVKLSTEKELDLVARPEALRAYDKIILPGVGAFADAMRVLHDRSMDVAVAEEYRKGKPILGICLGMQLLANVGHEHGRQAGLGLVPGEVVKLEGRDVRSIHMGWNDIVVKKDDPLLQNVPSGTDFYFVHGYCFDLKDPADCIATCVYGREFPVVIRHENAWGCQFHPEKSQQQGINILKNFVLMPNA